MPTAAFTRLRDFIATAMQMSHVYQPVMLRTLIDNGGKASVSEVAKALLAEDRAQLDYYREITKRMPGAVLRKRGAVDYADGAYSIPSFDEMTAAERHELIALCQAKFDEYLERRADPWSHRRKSAGYVSGTLRYEVLKRAVFRCELCGASAEDRALEVDHIVPRNAGGSDDLSNLQALCYSCNAMKRDRDTTDFRGMAARYRERSDRCIFCNIDAARIVTENELTVAIPDAFPVTEGHTLLIVGGDENPRLDGASSGQSASAEGFARWSDSGSVFWESNLWERHVPCGAARSSVCGDDAVVLAAIKDASRRLRRRPSGILDRRCARRRM